MTVEEAMTIVRQYTTGTTYRSMAEFLAAERFLKGAK